MTSFLALYRGNTVAEAKMIAVSADPDLVALVAMRLLESPTEDSDPVIERLERGRRAALRVIKKEVADAPA